MAGVKIPHCVRNDSRGVWNDSRGVWNDSRGVWNDWVAYDVFFLKGRGWI